MGSTGAMSLSMDEARGGSSTFFMVALSVGKVNHCSLEVPADYCAAAL